MALRVQEAGLIPFTSPKTTYDASGAIVWFNYGNHERWSSRITALVYSGDALISLDGNPAGPYISLGTGGSFDFGLRTNSIFIKGDGGNTEVCVVASLDPIEE